MDGRNPHDRLISNLLVRLMKIATLPEIGATELIYIMKIMAACVNLETQIMRHKVVVKVMTFDGLTDHGIMRIQESMKLVESALAPVSLLIFERRN
ncbi:hypothetical protein JNL27_16515 [bacterium]|nr:hypothetical protein [bacterium]